MFSFVFLVHKASLCSYFPLVYSSYAHTSVTLWHTFSPLLFSFPSLSSSSQFSFFTFSIHSILSFGEINRVFSPYNAHTLHFFLPSLYFHSNVFHFFPFWSWLYFPKIHSENNSLSHNLNFSLFWHLLLIPCISHHKQTFRFHFIPLPYI